MTNPYYGLNFFQFFQMLLSRIYDFLTGKTLSFASDEIQLITISLIAISSALIGTFLLLKKMTQLANALSHTILFGIVLAFLINRFFSSTNFEEIDFAQFFPAPSILIVCALITAFLTTFLTQFFVSKIGINEDASCGIVFTFLFAIGIIAVTAVSRNAHIGIELLMGNADMLEIKDLLFQCPIFLINLSLIFIFFRGFFITTFDPIFSDVLLGNSSLFKYLLMGQVAITSIGAFRAVGVLLVLAFFVGPPLVTRIWVNKLSHLVIISTFIGISATLIGVSLSRHLLSVYELPVSTSSLIVITIGCFYILTLLFHPNRGIISRFIHTRRLIARKN